MHFNPLKFPLLNGTNPIHFTSKFKLEWQRVKTTEFVSILKARTIASVRMATTDIDANMKSMSAPPTHATTTVSASIT